MEFFFEIENIEIVKLLIQSSIDVNLKTTSHGVTALYYAGDFHLIDKLDVKWICSTLGLYVADDRDDIVKMLIQHGADPNEKDSYGRTSLHRAILNGNFDAFMKYMWLWNFILSIVASLGYDKVVRVLVENKADINIEENEGQTPLHLCVLKGIYKNESNNYSKG